MKHIHPIYSGGLFPGDIVTHIDGKAIKNSTDVYDLLDENHEIQILSMTIFRGLKKMTITVKPEDNSR